ncbi:MAG: N-acetyltransferase [Bacteroidales bacterium]|nr:N-acetyltransferase [Bacteroidales bacterium]MBN2762788.1 N-acetyltransferase [Bacteroidales bacterium]
MKIEFEELNEKDLPLVRKIYEYYVENSTATFHIGDITIEEIRTFIPINHPVYKSYLIKANETVCGYCYLAPYKNRQAYNRTAEVTVYLKHEYTGRGIGRTALQKLEKDARFTQVKVLIGIITGDNIHSINLFTQEGYTKCAHFKEVGEKFGKVLDVVAYQKFIT